VKRSVSLQVGTTGIRMDGCIAVVTYQRKDRSTFGQSIGLPDLKKAYGSVMIQLFYIRPIEFDVCISFRHYYFNYSKIRPAVKSAWLHSVSGWSENNSYANERTEGHILEFARKFLEEV
jgi:hypothetical protein